MDNNVVMETEKCTCFACKNSEAALFTNKRIDDAKGAKIVMTRKFDSLRTYELEINGEDELFGNLLAEFLKMDTRVSYSAYKKEHPTSTSVKLVFELNNHGNYQTNPVDVLIDSINQQMREIRQCVSAMVPVATLI